MIGICSGPRFNQSDSIGSRYLNSFPLVPSTCYPSDYAPSILTALNWLNWIFKDPFHLWLICLDSRLPLLIIIATFPLEFGRFINRICPPDHRWPSVDPALIQRLSGWGTLHKRNSFNDNFISVIKRDREGSLHVRPMQRPKWATIGKSVTWTLLKMWPATFRSLGPSDCGPQSRWYPSTRAVGRAVTASTRCAHVTVESLTAEI